LNSAIWDERILASSETIYKPDCRIDCGTRRK
jgi:hypothetical protein